MRGWGVCTRRVATCAVCARRVRVNRAGCAGARPAHLRAYAPHQPERPTQLRQTNQRVNARIDNVLGFETHPIRGLDKGLALVVLLAMAVGRIRAGQAEHMRSLVRRVEPDWREAA